MASDYLEQDETEEDEGPKLDPAELFAFAVASARKHLVAGIVLLSLIASAAYAASVLLPKKWDTQTRILVRQDGFLDQINPGRAAPSVDEFQGLGERMFRQDNLREIVKRANLEARWTEHRPTLLRWKDELLGSGIETLDEKTRMRILVGTLETRLRVETDKATTITIGATWTDPETAQRIVEVARDLMFEERLQRDLEVFQKVLAIQEEQVKDAARDVDRLLKQVEDASWKPAATSTETEPTTKVVRVSQKPKNAAPDPLLTAKLEKVRQRIRDVQQPWQRRVQELKLQLSDLSATYAEKHPLIIHQKARIEEASVMPAELEELKAKEAELVGQIEEVSNTSMKSAARTIRVRTGGDSSSTDREATRIENSATKSAEQSKLIQAIEKYNDLNSRIESTRLEIATAEAAANHRYVIAAEAELPAAPLKPRLPLMIRLGGIVVGLLFGFLLGTALELSRGRLLAPWQVKQLGLPMLGELNMKETSTSES